MIAFLKEAKIELEKVHWPTRAQTIRLTQYVIGVSLVVGVYVSILDAIFKLGLEWVVLR